MKVKNMLGRTGREVANQFIISDNMGNQYFQSYKSIIAKRQADGSIILDGYFWDYSNTTAKYRREFLNEGIDATRAKIKSGEYILTDLN
jgi:hypothetical protein